MTTAPQYDDSELTHAEVESTFSAVFTGDALTTHLTKRGRGRCVACGAHVPTQGHVAGCRRRNVREVGTLFAGTDICAACGESFADPGLTQRCRPRHMRKASV